MNKIEYLFNYRYNLINQCLVEYAKKVQKIDLTYLDPPYNQHPYGSNYFMLNLINDYRVPKDVSRVSGIPREWNRSAFNKRISALAMLEDICKNLDSKFVLISYNSEGIVQKQDMENMLKRYGKIKIFTHEYNTYRGCRNLSHRSKHVIEYLYLLQKEKK